MLEDMFASQRLLLYGRAGVIDSIQHLKQCMTTSKEPVSVQVSQRHFTSAVTALLSNCLQPPVNSLIAQLIPYARQCSFTDTSLSIGIDANKTPMELLESCALVDQQARQVLKFLRLIDFEALTTPGSTSARLCVKVSKAGLVAVKQLASMVEVPDKDILKALLFEQIDASQRVIVPYSLEGCKENLASTLTQWATSIQLTVPLRLLRRHCNVKVVKAQCIGARQQSATSLFKILTKNQVIVVDPKDQLILIYCPISQRNLNNYQWFKFNLKAERGQGERLRWLCQQYTKLHAIKQASQQRNKRLLLRDLSLQYDCARCCQSMVEEVVTSEQCRFQTQRSLQTLQIYFRALAERRIFDQARQKAMSYSKVRSYLAAIPAMAELHQRAAKRANILIHVQSYIRCYMTKTRQLNLLREQIMADTLQARSDDRHTAQALSAAINKNHQAKAYEATAYVQVKVAWFNNICGSPVFDSLKQGLPALEKELQRKSERVQDLRVDDTSLTITTDKRRIIFGISNTSEEPSSVPQNYKWVTESGQNRALPIASQTNRHLLLISKNRELYFVGKPLRSESVIPSQVPLPSKVQKVRCGTSHSACLTRDGQLYYWGKFKNEEIRPITPRLWERSQRAVLDIECSATGIYALLENRQVWDVLNNALVSRSDSSELIPYELRCLRSLTLEIMLVKSINFSHTRLSLKDKKDIAKQISLKSNQHSPLFRVPFEEQYSSYFQARSLMQPQPQQDIPTEDPRLLQPGDHNTMSSGLDLTFSDTSI